jgi:hypothetical protein
MWFELASYNVAWIPASFGVKIIEKAKKWDRAFYVVSNRNKKHQMFYKMKSNGTTPS